MNSFLVVLIVFLLFVFHRQVLDTVTKTLGYLIAIPFALLEILGGKNDEGE